MESRKSTWFLVLIGGVIIEVISILMITKVISLPNSSFAEKNPLFIAGLLLACGFILIIKGFRMRKEEKND